MIGLKLAIDFGERFQSVLLADTPDLMPLSGSYPPPPQRLSSAERISDIAPSLAGDEAALGVVAEDRDELCAIVGLGAQALVRDDDRGNAVGATRSSTSARPEATRSPFARPRRSG
jgi:hypothetical protein